MRLCTRHNDGKGAALVDTRVHDNLVIQQVADTFHNEQPETGAGTGLNSVRQARKFLEDNVERVLGNARSAITYFEAETAGIPATSNQYRARSRIADRIADEVLQDRSQKTWVERRKHGSARISA